MNSDEMLDDIGRELPKKVRKKLRWKKISPILSVFITLLINVTNALGGARKSKSSPVAERHSPAVLPPQEFQDDTLQAYVSKARAYGSSGRG